MLKVRDRKGRRREVNSTSRGGDMPAEAISHTCMMAVGMPVVTGMLRPAQAGMHRPAQAGKPRLAEGVGDRDRLSATKDSRAICDVFQA